MAGTPDLRDLLKTQVDTIEKPKLYPAGAYRGTVTKFEYGKSAQKETPYVRYFVRLDEIAEGGGLTEEDIEGITLGKQLFRTDFYLTADALFRLKDFMTALDIQTSGLTLNEVIPEVVNQEVLVSLTQREFKRAGASDEDEPEKLAEIARIAAWKA